MRSTGLLKNWSAWRSTKWHSFTFVEEAENWWNLIKPSIPTVGSIVLWDTFKVKFLDNYSQRDLFKHKVKGKQVMERPKRVERNTKRDFGRNQKSYAKPCATIKGYRYLIKDKKIEWYWWGGPHNMRYCGQPITIRCSLSGLDSIHVSQQCIDSQNHVFLKSMLIGCINH